MTSLSVLGGREGSGASRGEEGKHQNFIFLFFYFKIETISQPCCHIRNTLRCPFLQLVNLEARC